MGKYLYNKHNLKFAYKPHRSDNLHGCYTIVNDDKLRELNLKHTKTGRVCSASSGLLVASMGPIHTSGMRACMANTPPIAQCILHQMRTSRPPKLSPCGHFRNE